MIDRIRHDIEERLDQLLGEAEKLRRALVALGTRDGSESAGAARSKPPQTKAQGRKRSATTSASPAVTALAEQPATAKRKRRSRSSKPSSSGARTAPGATKNAVLAALATGEAMTASDVATSTGLGRATVSTTLSKLAKTGEVTKAERGYRLPQGADPSA